MRLFSCKIIRMDKYTVLSDSEVAQRLERYGFNELPAQKPKSFISLLFTVVREPMIFLLLAAGLVYLLLGEPQDSTVLFVSIVVVIGITFYQERKTENALQALKDLSSPRALVIRNGNQIRIPGREVVKGDIIILQEGDRVPADAVVLSALNLMIDESLLTGESLPVRKNVRDGLEGDSAPGGEHSYKVYSGTLISQGSGIAEVTETGVETEMGKIGKTLQSIEDVDSLLKKEIGKIVKIFAVLGIVSCVALIGIHYSMNGDLLNAFLAGLTLSMSMLPEEFPVVLLIFLTLGAWRISKSQVLTRNSQSIETLGATSVLCVDKTGTLTFNKMELTDLVSLSEKFELNIPEVNLKEAGREILKFAKLSSKRNAFDPLEKEINSKYEKDVGENFGEVKLIREYPLTRELLALTRVWKIDATENLVVAAKGAPEAIMKLCRFNSEQKESVMSQVLEMSKMGRRVLGVAKAVYKNNDLPESPEEIEFEYLGLIGFVDPVRPTVKASMEECYKAGMRVIMITGDYPGTAQYIAEEAGIRNTDKYLTGADLQILTPEELQEKIKYVNIFARVVPEQKLNIVNALKANGEVVAMTGDGVNDGPALKTAHIGVAMGERGTDVARESADLVLLNDDFSSIVSAVKLGRRIYDNLQKAVSYIFSIHIPIAGVALLPTLLNLPTVLFPVHIAFLELVIDPACSTVFEAENPEKEIMSRKPRDVDKPLFGRSHVATALLQGLTLLFVVMAVLFIARHMGRDEGTVRSMVFTTLVMCNLVLIYSNLSRGSMLQKYERHKNKAFHLIAAGAALTMVVALTVPFVQDLFHFSSFGLVDFVMMVSMTVLCAVWLEFFKVFRADGYVARAEK